MVTLSSLWTILLHRLPLLTSFHFLRSTWNSPRALRAVDSIDKPCSERLPPKWPDKLVVVQRRVPDPDSKVGPVTAVTYYDPTARANLIQLTPDDGGPVLWDLELDNHTSYFFYPSTRECRVMHFPVGVLRSNWLDGATSLGESKSWDGSKDVCGWTKLNFIDYFVDKETMEPTSWYFHAMKATWNVVYYAPHASASDLSIFTPPKYCEEGSRSRFLAKEDLGWMGFEEMKQLAHCNSPVCN